MTDAEIQHINVLITNVASGDEKSLAELYTLCFKGLFSVARNITRNKDGAEDVIQEVFVKVVRRAKSFKRKDNGYGWLCAITRNTAISYIRKNKPNFTQDIDECFALFDPYTMPEKRDERLEIRAALDNLSPPERRLLYLKYFCDMTVREIAAAENMKKSTVAYGVSRAEEKLKEFLKN